MQPKTISVQQLRTQLPQISQNLQKGVSYILIRRSKPIAELKPIAENTLNSQPNALELFSNPPQELLMRTIKKTAVQLVRESRNR